jgi:pSer/pThr/pTyr-binding forkhead associated (FHA) protein
MKVTLTVSGGRHNGREIAIGLTEVLIGRDDKCNIQLDSEDVSRVHCALVIGEREVLLRDQNSSNGTFVNKRRLRGEIQLEDGDAIQVGPQLFTIRIEGEAGDVTDGSGEFVIGDHPSKTLEPTGSTTVIGKVPVIDPSDLEAAEKERLRNRLKGL